jgi:hypothetical protein
MAVARLLIAGINRNSRPAKLLGVDDTQTNLHVEGRHAELWDLRIRTASHKTWRTVGACYEYENEWRVTSLVRLWAARTSVGNQLPSEAFAACTRSGPGRFMSRGKGAPRRCSRLWRAK